MSEAKDPRGAKDGSGLVVPVQGPDWAIVFLLTTNLLWMAYTSGTGFRMSIWLGLFHSSLMLCAILILGEHFWRRTQTYTIEDSSLVLASGGRRLRIPLEGLSVKGHFLPKWIWVTQADGRQRAIPAPCLERGRYDRFMVELAARGVQLKVRTWTALPDPAEKESLRERLLAPKLPRAKALMLAAVVLSALSGVALWVVGLPWAGGLLALFLIGCSLGVNQSVLSAEKGELEKKPLNPQLFDLSFDGEEAEGFEAEGGSWKVNLQDAALEMQFAPGERGFVRRRMVLALLNGQIHPLTEWAYHEQESWPLIRQSLLSRGAPLLVKEAGDE